MRILTAAFIAVLLAACGADQTAAFGPIEHVWSINAAGQPAASYEVRSGSKVVASVKLWSRGAHRRGDSRTLVELAAEVRNVGSQPVELARDQLRLEAFDERGEPIRTPRLDAIRVDGGGSLVVPPGEAVTVRPSFALPGIDPDRVAAFRLRWGLVHDDGQRYLQLTEFKQARPPRKRVTTRVAYDPVFGLYDPWLYAPPWQHHTTYLVPTARVTIVDRDHHPHHHR